MKKALGRGLGSIIKGGIQKSGKIDSGEDRGKLVGKAENVVNSLFSEIAIEKIKESKYQARKEFVEEDIKQLADSIASEGLIQPISLRPIADGFYELIAGERRLRACRMLGMKKIIASVQQSSDSSSAIKGLIENLQRTDLNPIEEAKGLANLMNNFSITQEMLSERLGKPRSSLANSLRLLTLSTEIQGYIAKGLLTHGHAKVLLSIEEGSHQILLARKVIEMGLNVRSTEEAVKRLRNEKARRTVGTVQESVAEGAVIKRLENKISSRLNASVELKHSAKRGKIIIEYIGNEDLQRILELLGVDS